MSRFDHLLTEQPNPASADIDAVSTEEMLRIINAEDRKVAEAVGREIPAIARAVDAIVGVLENGGSLFYIGAGTSGRLGVLDASECAPTFSVPPNLVQGIIAGGEPALTRATVPATSWLATLADAMCWWPLPLPAAPRMCSVPSPKPRASAR